MGFRFDVLSVYLLSMQHGVDLNSLDKIDKDEYVPSWLWCAYRSWCMFKYRKPRVSYLRMKAFMDNMRKSDWDKITEVMRGSSGPAGKAGDKKKVQHGTISLSQDGGQE
jgi:hypothetical protein